MLWAACPECETRVQLPRTARLGDQLECPECAERLEIISLHPLRLDYAYAPEEDLEEDWEWEDDEEDDLDEELEVVEVALEELQEEEEELDTDAPL